MVNYSGSRGQEMVQKIVAKWLPDETEFTQSHRAEEVKLQIRMGPL